MDKIIVYFDDAAYAQQHLVPMPAGGASPGPGRDDTHWVLVACAPRMTQRIGKWVSHSARENWRAKWAEKQFGVIVPALKERGGSITTMLAKGPLLEMTRNLLQTHGSCLVLDARRPKFGVDLQPVTPNQATPQNSKWTLPGAVVGMGTVLVLAAE